MTNDSSNPQPQGERATGETCEQENLEPCHVCEETLVPIEEYTICDKCWHRITKDIKWKKRNR